MKSPMETNRKRYVVLLTDWRLVIDAHSELEACRLAIEEFKEKLKPEVLICWEDPMAHYVNRDAPESPAEGT